MAAVFAVPPQSNVTLDNHTAAAQSAMPSSSETHHDHLSIDLAVGIPAQHIKARASFSSADTVIFSGSSVGFDPSSSTSFIQGLRDGRVTIDERQHVGNVSNDRIEINGWVVRDASFVESEAGPSGHGAFLGLGYKSFVGPDNEALVHRLSTKWEKPYYGLYLPPRGFHSSIADSWRRTSPQEGSVSFGQADPRYAKGSVQWLESDSRPDGAWSVPFDGVSIDRKIVPMKHHYPEASAPDEDPTAFRTTSIRSGSRTTILVDKNSRKYVLPDAMVDGLMDEVEGAVKWEHGPSNRTIWELPCDSRNRIVLKLGTMDFRLRPDDWMFSTNNRCFSEFAYLSESGGEAQVGSRFLEAFYTLWNLNPPEVGLMRLNRDLPSPRTEPPPPPGLDALSAEDLELSGPIPSLGLATASFPVTSERHGMQHYFLVVFGICASIYCVFRLWRRGKMPFTPRSPRYSPLSKELPV